MVAVQMRVQCLPFMCVVLCVLKIQGVSCQAWGVNFTHDRICAVRGSSVAMPCSFTHPPHSTITKVFWTINPKPNKEPTDLLHTPDYKNRVFYSAKANNNCTLTLRHVKLTDAGEYHTRILTENENERWLQQPGISLSTTDLSVWIPTPVIEGSHVRLSCNNTCKTKNNPTVIWWKNDDPLSVNNELILVNVTMEDEGYYSCALKGFEEHPSALARLYVMFAPKNTSMTVTPSEDVSVGDTVTLTCSSVAKPPVENYTWFKVGEFTPVGSGQQYNITDICMEDGGQYYCEASNEIGKQKSQFVLIRVTTSNRGIHHEGYMAFIIIGVMVVAIVGISWIIHMIRGQTKIEISLESRAAAGPAGGEEDDSQYSTIQPHSPVQSEDPQLEEEEEAQYIAVYLPKPGERTAIQPEEALETIYCNA